MSLKTYKNIAWRFLQTFGKQGVIFVMFLISAKLLSPLEFSTYTYVFVIINIFVLFCDFGISSSVSKFSADFIVKKDTRIHNIIPTFSFFIFWISLAITIVLLTLWKTFFSQDEYSYLLISSILIFFIPMIGIYDGLYRWNKEFKKLSIINVFAWILWIIIFVFCIKTWWIIWAFIWQILYNFILYILLFIYSPIKNTWKFHKGVFTQFSKYAVYIWVATIWYALFVKADIVAMRQFWYMLEIWHYELVMRFIDILILPFILIWQVIWPNKNKFFLERKYKVVQKNMIRDSFIIWWIWVIISIGIYYWSTVFFQSLFSWYDIKIIQTIVFIILLSIPLRLVAAYTTQAYITPSWNFKQTTYSIVFFWILNVISNIILTPIYWVEAIFISTTVFLVLYLICKDILFLFSLKK